MGMGRRRESWFIWGPCIGPDSSRRVGILRCLCGGYDAVPFSHKIVKLCIPVASVAPVQYVALRKHRSRAANPENGYHGELGSAKGVPKCLDFSHSWVM